ncbi:MAG: Fe-S protein [SAR86 cluster bacterium SAR86A]|uniref:Fe-S protein n=1 Tax=SAR86 cluster bacterium SAR86A TaxID=1123866 RepID=J4KS85_9GAMM|nr:MAG: Fe-S protein [SAR86 cluster bacterium SAR86A]
MPKLQKKRSSTPCLGICSTTFGDEVCKGCKRFAHEIVSWTKYSQGEREIVNDRLEKFKIQILQHRFAITDKNLFESMLEEKAINFNHSLDPLTWIFDLFRAAGSQTFDISNFGIKSLVQFNPKTIRDEINNELLELSEAHHERYFKKN